MKNVRWRDHRTNLDIKLKIYKFIFTKFSSIRGIKRNTDLARLCCVLKTWPRQIDNSTSRLWFTAFLPCPKNAPAREGLTFAPPRPKDFCPCPALKSLSFAPPHPEAKNVAPRILRPWWSIWWSYMRLGCRGDTVRMKHWSDNNMMKTYDDHCKGWYNELLVHCQWS